MSVKDGQMISYAYCINPQPQHVFVRSSTPENIGENLLQYHGLANLRLTKTVVETGTPSSLHVKGKTEVQRGAWSHWT